MLLVTGNTRPFEDRLEPLLVESLDSQPRQTVAKEAAESVVEGAGRRIGLEQPDGLRDDGVEIFAIEEEPSLQAEEEERCVADIRKGPRAATRQPLQIVGALSG